MVSRFRSRMVRRFRSRMVRRFRRRLVSRLGARVVMGFRSRILVIRLIFWLCRVVFLFRRRRRRRPVFMLVLLWLQCGIEMFRRRRIMRLRTRLVALRRLCGRTVLWLLRRLVMRLRAGAVSSPRRFRTVVSRSLEGALVWLGGGGAVRLRRRAVLLRHRLVRRVGLRQVVLLLRPLLFLLVGVLVVA